MERALILAPFSRQQLDRMRPVLDVAYESWLETRRLYSPDELACRLQKESIAVLVVEADFVFEEVFQQTSSLKFVGVCRGSTNQVDVESATQRGVVVVNTPFRNAQAVAEHALGLMLALARGIPYAHQYVKEGRWQNPAEPYMKMRGVELAGRTLGVVGLGEIGKRLAGICLALGMKVVSHDPHVSLTPPGVAMVALEDLMAEADFVSVHVPVTDDTEGLLDARLLSTMKPTAYLINLSDAALVDQGALVETLRRGGIGGAAFDVFDTHPIATDNPLLSLGNVVLTPHLGGATEETIERHSRMMADDVLRFLGGQRPEHLVNPEVWDRRGQ